MVPMMHRNVNQKRESREPDMDAMLREQNILLSQCMFSRRRRRFAKPRNFEGIQRRRRIATMGLKHREDCIRKKERIGIVRLLRWWLVGKIIGELGRTDFAIDLAAVVISDNGHRRQFSIRVIMCGDSIPFPW